MKKIISFFKTDIKIINSYFLFSIILVILLCIGYTSYALFSFTKTSNNIIELTVGKLKKADLNDLIKLADNKNDSGLYTIIHPKDTTLQIGNDKDITEYRYRGASPKNYVTFNNEVWRIIGIFPTDDGTGKIENRIKIIRNESIKSDKWNTSSSNDWINSSLNTYLNETYYNSIKDDYKKMIVFSKYYLGGSGGNSFSVDTMYGIERSNNSSYFVSYKNLISKIGLMYASDYGYATENCESSKLSALSTCNNSNWLYNLKIDEWLLNSRPGWSNVVYKVSSSGSIDPSDGSVCMGGGTCKSSSNGVEHLNYAIRPVLYLNKDVKIIGGTGTSTSPYRISYEEEPVTLIEKNVIATNGIINIAGKNGIEKIVHAANNTLQIGATESITEYRYRGEDPKNYVSFNGETWRILGVFPTDDGTGKIENRIKIVRNESIKSDKWNTSSSNNWINSSLNTYLNETYYNSIKNDYKKMIVFSKYYLGNSSSNSLRADAMYGIERRNDSSYLLSKIGLMYASDYGYAASSLCNEQLEKYSSLVCKDTNWLYNLKVDEWLLNSRPGWSNVVYKVSSSGSIDPSDGSVCMGGGTCKSSSNGVEHLNYAIRPVLYLNKDVKIIGGTGTSDNMYQLSIDIEIKNYPLTDGALTLSKLEDNKDNSGLYKILNAKDTTLQIGTNENTVEYRYRGKDPKNYVKFNNEVWRIIGIFPTDDGTGKIENRIKLIRNESIEKDFWNSGSDVNNWAESALQKKLNSTYLTGLTGEAKLMIDNTKYYLGGYNDYHISSIQMYNYERKVGGSEYYYTYGTYVNPANWIGKIGLMYVSDYGYASGNCESKALASGVNYSDTTLQKCNDTNWLYNLKTGEWLLTPYSKSNAKVYKLFEEGYIQEYYTKYNSSYYNSQAVRPVLYLKSNVKITGGTGTNANPYTLSL